MNHRVTSVINAFFILWRMYLCDQHLVYLHEYRRSAGPSIDESLFRRSCQQQRVSCSPEMSCTSPVQLQRQHLKRALMRSNYTIRTSRIVATCVNSESIRSCRQNLHNVRIGQIGIGNEARLCACKLDFCNDKQLKCNR